LVISIVSQLMSAHHSKGQPFQKAATISDRVRVRTVPD